MSGLEGTGMSVVRLAESKALAHIAYPGQGTIVRWIRIFHPAPAYCPAAFRQTWRRLAVAT